MLVNDYEGKCDNSFAAIYSLGRMFGINITEGRELADERMLMFLEKELGTEVPEPFYRGFPDSVKALSPDEILFDRIVHYTKTYGFGMFDNPGHSIMEEFIGRTAFNEGVEVKDFVIVNEKDAEKLLLESMEKLFAGTRPLNDYTLEVVEGYISDYDYVPYDCASKNLAIRIIIDLRKVEFSKFLALSDVTKLAEEMDFRARKIPWLFVDKCRWKLNLNNQDRKLITSVINEIFKNGNCNITECFERKAKWSGLLHHIHYKPLNEESEEFVNLMRGKENHSVYSEFEGFMSEGKAVDAAKLLREKKGSGALLRMLEYIVSRCESDEQVHEILKLADTNNTFILLQLVAKYGYLSEKGRRREFIFTKHNTMVIHRESEEEVEARRSFIGDEKRELIKKRVYDMITAKLKGRLGRVYIDYDMKRIALPLQENTSQGGFGVLPKGSRIPIPAGKKIRAFTYWEKVNDIDLSCFGVRDDGSVIEFSWRTFSKGQKDAITFSGDETSGYKGGSEYFDIVLSDFKEMYPGVHYIVFCDNVYSALPFSSCICKAGFMMRDINDSGKVFEPKTVTSSYTINCESTFAYLFAIDLRKREFVWLNMTRQGCFTVAGDSSLEFLKPYIVITDTLNMHSFFSMLATEVVTTPSEADVIVSDKPVKAGGKAEIIRSCDFEKVAALMK